MKNVSFALMLLAAGVLLSFSSCFKKDFDSPPDLSSVDPMLPVNMTIKQLKTLMPSSGSPKLIDSNWTIYGIVTADDRSGNFYKQINIEDSTGGITILINQNSLYTKYPVGRKVYVKLKGLYYGFYGGLPQLGIIDNGSMGQIPATVTDNFIVRASYPHTIKTDTLTLAALASPNTAYLNRLVTIRDVEFMDNELGTTYAADPNTSSQSGTNRSIHSCSGSGSIIVRTSNYANFRDVKIPGGKGTITGIYTVFNGDAQLVIRDTNDVRFRGLRCDGTTGNYLFSEGFNDQVSGEVSLPGWTNFAEKGTKKWTHSNQGSTSNPYARISAFQSGQDTVVSWLVTPAIDLAGTNAPKLSFRNTDGFDNGAKLQVFISTDFTGTGNPALATWTQLNATISTGHSSGFGSFISSGNIDLSAYIGQKVYIGWRYEGSDPAKTTTYEIDEVKVMD